ncbi:MAG: thiamine-phosphate kinase [Candidatus Omnitrophica bacterium]|nr:thiamine-phosphate kinase [Candidatus Omnitrophota bacterium]
MVEKQIVQWLKSNCLIRNKKVKIGIGDDTAVLEYDKKHYLLLTTDIVVENVHFKLTEAKFSQIGRKALAVNISDIAAMGGIPAWALVSLGLPEKKASAFKSIFKGIIQLAKSFSIDIIGGNLSRSDIFFVDIFLVGMVEKKNLVLRSTGKPGDLVFVTGTLGGAQKRKQFEFIPRVKEARIIASYIKPTAMIDLSDGLASDARKLAEASNCGIEIEAEKIPISKDANRYKPIFSALYDGEDYELVFTVSPDNAEKVPEKISGLKITRIGKLIKQKIFVLKYSDGKQIKLQEEKFKHFK